MTAKKEQLSLRQHLIRGASGTLILKVSSTGLTLLLAVVLARVLGVEGFGIYAFCLSVVQILTVPAMLGGQQLLVREVAAYQSRGNLHLLRGLLKRILQASFLTSLILALCAAVIGFWIYPDLRMLLPFLVALLLIPLLSALRLYSAALRGLKHVLLGQAAQTMRPMLVIILIGVMFWHTDRTLRPESALTAQVICTGLIVAATYLLLRRLLPQGVKQVRPGYETSKWVKSMLPFVFAGGMQILNKETSIVLLAALQGPQDVGLFRVAQRGAELVPFGLMAVNMAIAPTVSELFIKGDKQRLQRLISKSVLAVMAFALPVALILILGGKWLIPLIFGPDYTTAYMPLVILCLGQLVNAGMGSVGVILNMVGLERITARGVAIAAVVCVVLNFALIPIMGKVGAAIATSASLIVWNILLFVWLYRKTGIISTIRWSFKDLSNLLFVLSNV